MANKYAVETAFKLIDKATDPLSKIGVKGNAIGKQLKKDFMKAQDQLSSLGKSATKAGLAIAAAGAIAVTAWAANGVKDAVEYDLALRKVSTVADTTTISMDELSAGLMKVSNFTGNAVSELADLQYQAIVSGIKTADSVGFVETAVKAATAAFTEETTVIDGLTAVMNAYQLEASAADTIAGQMLITNNLGKTSFEELNSSLGRVLPTAARLNVGTDELFASIATLTANSIETPKAVKGLQSILASVQKPTTAAAKAAKALGIDFSSAALRSKGLSGFLQEIQEKTGGSEDAIISLFGTVEALNAVTTITGKGAEQFSAALGEMQNATEKLNTAFDTIDASPAERWGDIINIIKNAGISIGTKLLPVVEKVTVKVEEFAGKIQDYDFTPVAEKVSGVFDKIFVVGEFFVSLIGVIWKLRVPILALVSAIALYKGGMLIAAMAVNTFTAAQNISKGVQLAVALITGNQTNAMAIYKAGTMGASVQTMLFAARQKAAMGVNFAGTLIKQGAAFIALKAQLIAAKVATIAYSVAQKAAAIAGQIATGVQWALNAAMTANPIGLIIAGVVALIAVIVILVKNWDKIINAMKAAWDWIKNLAKVIWGSLINAFKKLGEFIKKNTDQILAFVSFISLPLAMIIGVIKELKNNWGAIVETFKTDGIIAGLKKLGSVILNGLLAPFKGFYKMLQNIPGFDDLIGTIKNGFSSAWQGIKNRAANVWDGIKNGAGAAADFFKNRWEDIKNAGAATFNFVDNITGGSLARMKDNFLNTINQIKEFFFGLWEALKIGPAETFEYIKNAFLGLFESIKQCFFGFIDTIREGWESVKGFLGDIGIAIRNGFSSAWQGIKNGASNAWDGIKNGAGAAADFFKNRWEDIKNAGATTFNFVDNITGGSLTRMKDNFFNTINQIKEFFFGLWEALKAGPAETFEYIKNAFLGLFESIKQRFFGFIDTIREGWKSVTGFFSGIGNGVKNFFTGGGKEEPANPARVLPAQLQTKTSGAVANIPSYGIPPSRNNQTITAAATTARPMTTAEQYIYNQTTNRDEVDISVRAEQGSAARVTRPPRSPNVKLTFSGGNY